MMHTGRGKRLHAASILLMILISISWSRPAYGALPALQVSTDAATFSSQLDAPLFDSIDVVVPGDRQTGSFWVRNNAATAGYLRVVLADVVTSSPELADALLISASTTGHSGDPVPLSSATPCRVLVEGDLIPPSGVVEVAADLVFSAAVSGTRAQGQTGSLSLRVGLSDAALGGLPPTSCDGTPTDVPIVDPLPGPPDVPGVEPASEPPADPTANSAFDPGNMATTGFNLPYSVLMVASATLGVGLFLLLAARRRRREES